MMNQDHVCAVVLAAGKGTRMKSHLPKVLHPLAGRSVLSWVLKAVRDSGIDQICLVLGPETAPFQNLIASEKNISVVIQHNQRGTGDAVASAGVLFQGAAKSSYANGSLLTGSPFPCQWVLIVTGDTPAIDPKTLQQFVSSTLSSDKKLAVLGMNIENPFGYGRLVQDPQGNLMKIVEERDADDRTKAIRLCNSGIIMAETKYLFELLSQLSPVNSQGEYYLTDVFSQARERGALTHVFETKASHEFLGVNNRAQLSELEEVLLAKHMETLCLSGVTIHRPQSCYIDVRSEIGGDVEIYPNVTIKGYSKIGSGVVLESGTVLEDTVVENNAIVGANCVLVQSYVKSGDRVPPLTSRRERNF